MNLSPSRLWTAFQLWRLSKSWMGGRRWYQYIDFGSGLTTASWSAGDTKLRTTSFLSFLNGQDLLMQDDVVVDIGCNAGLFSLVAAQTCKRVYGVEIDKPFWRQAQFVKKRWKTAGNRVNNVTFMRGDIMAHLGLLSQATVVFASKVLYHVLLGERVLKLMEAIEMGPVRLIIMQGHTVRGGHGQDEGMRALVTKHGFQYRLAEDVPEFPIAIASRDITPT